MLVAHLPRESATARAVGGPEVQWSDLEHLIAHVVDLLAAANWQRGNGKGPRPRLCPRPGQVDPDKKHYGKGALPLSEAAAFFKAWREGAFAGGEN